MTTIQETKDKMKVVEAAIAMLKLENEQQDTIENDRVWNQKMIEGYQGMLRKGKMYILNNT